MDALFGTFNANIGVSSFAELSGCVFSWLEEYCKPQVGTVVTCVEQMWSLNKAPKKKLKFRENFGTVLQFANNITN